MRGDRQARQSSRLNSLPGLLRPAEKAGFRCPATGASMSANKSSAIRRQLSHPVIDADGHWLELFPIFFDYLAEVGGPGTVDAYRAQLKRTTNWYQVSPEGRARERIHRQSWWTLPTNTVDRTAAMVPALFYDRL